jgi:hypothetical protein
VPGGRSEIVVGAWFGSSEGVLHFREGLFNRIEVGRVRWKMEEGGPTGLNGGACARSVVGAEVVHDDELAWSEGRPEDVTYVAHKAVGGHGSIESQAWSDPFERERRDHGHVLATVHRRWCCGPYATRCPGMRRGEAQMASRLVQEDEVLGTDCGHSRSPGGTRRLIPLTRRQRLFFRVQFRRLIVRLIVAVLTATPAVSRHHEHNSANVDAGRSMRRSGRAACSGAIFNGGAPGTGFGVSLPVSRFKRSHRSTVGKDTSKRAAIEARGATVLHLPPYSPDFNPIEEAFSKVKQALRRAEPRTDDDLRSAIWAAFDTITPRDAAGWFAHSGYAANHQPS